MTQVLSSAQVSPRIHFTPFFFKLSAWPSSIDRPRKLVRNSGSPPTFLQFSGSTIFILLDPQGVLVHSYLRNGAVGEPRTLPTSGYRQRTHVYQQRRRSGAACKPVQTSGKCLSVLPYALGANRRDGQCLGGCGLFDQQKCLCKRKTIAFFLSDGMMLVVSLFLVVPSDHFLASLVLSGGAIGIRALVHYSQQLYPEPEQLVIL